MAPQDREWVREEGIKFYKVLDLENKENIKGFY